VTRHPSGDQDVFLPAKWSAADGVAVVLPRNDAVRLEFFPSSAAATAQRLSCQREAEAAGPATLPIRCAGLARSVGSDR